MKQPADSTIIVCSIVRDAEEGLKKNIPVMINLLSRFKDYRVIIYENDSKDGTKQLLREWREVNPKKIHVELYDTNASSSIPNSKEVSGVNPFFSYKRISKMASLRNKYMDYIEKQGWKADYMMVVDLDVAQLFLKPILTSFDMAKEWDVVTAYGYSTSPSLEQRYHDTFAMVDYGEENIPQTESSIYGKATALAKELKNKQWKRVYSAFGGLALYRFELVEGLKYQAIKNDDKRVEVRCEHFSLYKQMVDVKPDLAVYINPEMVLKYQSVSLKLIWKTIKRKFVKH